MLSSTVIVVTCDEQLPISSSLTGGGHSLTLRSKLTLAFS